ncbi:MAG: energy-coupling factor transporter ATPase [Lachnospiraceae bacterium]|nr:energy-coupling factor transporter ATPase [Lachnospiraceae bacterium]
MSIIKAKNVKYKVKIKNENNEVIEEKKILNDLNIEIEPGDFIAILGHNGSGKSTFAKHLNALLLPDEGNIYIDGEDTKSVEELWKIREKCGMVFQNPDNQIVGVTVEEDVGFGPENLGVKTEKIWDRIKDSLTKVDMYKYRKKSPNHLSGGQKQRVAIASSLAMKSKCIVLDEPTAMLDPQGRKEVMDIIKSLNENENITVILITHHMNEAIMAKKVVVIDDGKIALQGTPREVFSNVEQIKKLKLDMPQIMELSYELYKCGKFDRYDILTIDEFIKELEKRGLEKHKIKNSDGIDGNIKESIDEKVEENIKDNVEEKYFSNEIEKISKSQNDKDTADREDTEVTGNKDIEPILSLNNVSLKYEENTSMEVKALDDISLDIYNDEFIGIIGHTGSGKSSLVQVMNGLIKATDGNVTYKGENIQDKSFDKKRLHLDVGLVFQYPESQLFEETVLKDVMFGPLNKGMSEEEAKKAAKEALEMLGIGENYYNDSPFELSGGEKRRIAIAGVLAMNPEIIILDEPTAGLDPMSRNNLLNSLKRLQTDKTKTIIIVSHNMEDMANYVERLIVMNDGRVVFDDIKKNVFKYVGQLEQIGLDVPEVTKAMNVLKERNYNVSGYALTVKEALDEMKGII